MFLTVSSQNPHTFNSCYKKMLTTFCFEKCVYLFPRSFIFRAFHFCKACHEDVRDETQIKKCKCKSCKLRIWNILIIQSFRLGFLLKWKYPHFNLRKDPPQIVTHDLMLFSFSVAGAKVTSILNAFKPNKERTFEKKGERTTLAHVNGRWCLL